MADGFDFVGTEKGHQKMRILSQWFTIFLLVRKKCYLDLVRYGITGFRNEKEKFYRFFHITYVVFESGKMDNMLILKIIGDPTNFF